MLSDDILSRLAELSETDRKLDAEICAALIGDGVGATSSGLIVVPAADGKNTCLPAPEITREIVKARELMKDS